MGGPIRGDRPIDTGRAFEAGKAESTGDTGATTESAAAKAMKASTLHNLDALDLAANITFSTADATKTLKKAKSGAGQIPQDSPDSPNLDKAATKLRMRPSGDQAVTSPSQKGIHFTSKEAPGRLETTEAVAKGSIDAQQRGGTKSKALEGSVRNNIDPEDLVNAEVGAIMDSFDAEALGATTSGKNAVDPRQLSADAGALTAGASRAKAAGADLMKKFTGADLSPLMPGIHTVEPNPGYVPPSVPNPPAA